MINPVLILLFALIVTAFIEGVFALLFKPGKKRLVVSVIANFATNPILNLLLAAVYIICPEWCYVPFVILGETAVVFFEAYLYKALLFEKYKKSLLLSLILNFVSFVSGLLLIDFFLSLWVATILLKTALTLMRA